MSSITINAPEARPLYPSKEASARINYEAAIKTGLWSIGTIVFCLAMVDFYAQTYARETQIGLQSAQTEKQEINQDLRISDITPFIVGSPTIQTRPADKYTSMCKEMRQYTWKGFFKSYSISVYIGLGDNPSIDFVHGPGDIAEETGNQSASL